MTEPLTRILRKNRQKRMINSTLLKGPHKKSLKAIHYSEAPDKSAQTNNPCARDLQNQFDLH